MGRDAVGNIGHLHGVRIVRGSHRHAIRLDQRQDVARLGTELEIGVERCPGNLPVFVRGKDHHVTVGGQIGAGKPPFHEIGGIVRQKPAIHVYRIGTRVVNLDPIRECAIFISQGMGVIGHELADGEAVLRAGRPRHGKQSEEQGGEKQAMSLSLHGCTVSSILPGTKELIPEVPAFGYPFLAGTSVGGRVLNILQKRGLHPSGGPSTLQSP